MAMQYRNFKRPAPSPQPRAPRAFTLVEMLVAMAITLVMMAAVVTLFANVSNSVRNRRATIEMSSQLRHVRNVLQQDLQGATCPGLTWQRPESNHGYIELIEGQYREGTASQLLDARPSDGVNWPPTPENPEIDHIASTLPASNLPFNNEPETARWVTDGAGLGDYDDILMLTSRNEHEPFIGRMPTDVRTNGNVRANQFHEWGNGTIESSLAEVVWFAVENPGYTDDPTNPSDGESDPSADGFFGEPGMRTIYRRALLIAPWLNPYRVIRNDGTVLDTFRLSGESVDFQAKPGLLRVLIDDINLEDLEKALASLVAFQERYDISARLEFDPNLGSDGRYVILANTLGDLTKRENRYEHYSFRPGQGSNNPPSRDFPYAAISMGSGYGSNPSVTCWPDLESPDGPPPNDYLSPAPPSTEGDAELADEGGLQKVVVAYTLKNPFPAPGNPRRQRYKWRPFAFVDDGSDTLATARVMLNDNGEVVRIIHGLAPLSGDRRGEDVMMTSVLAFDLRLYDPGAPLFGHVPTDTVLDPADPGWLDAYTSNDNMGSGAVGQRTTSSNVVFPYVGQGAFVDLGYGYTRRTTPPSLLPIPVYSTSPDFRSSPPPWYFTPRALSDVFGQQLAPGYAVYDTWSFHYENNGVNEDDDSYDANPDPTVANWQPMIDEGTNGIDDRIPNGGGNPLLAGDHVDDVNLLGVDDVGERETAPPYDKPLRGVQVLIRTYELDSRAIRQVRVNQHFMPE